MLVKLQLTGKNCQMHTDPEIIISISQKLTKKDSVIFVSLNGKTKELVTAAKNCYDAEIGSILVTVNHSSTLKDYCENSARCLCIAYGGELRVFDLQFITIVHRILSKTI